MALRRVKADLRTKLNRVVRASLGRAWSRALLNRVYQQLSFAQKGAFHARFAAIFRDGANRPISGGWTVTFAGRPIRIPLRPDHVGLDWDAAVSLLGHEIEIKETYAALLRSRERPDLFLDVGANFGTHSLLHLVHGIKVISFEPNMACHESFGVWCTANGVRPRLEAVAIGQDAGIARLRYPEREPWLGTTEEALGTELEARYALKSQPVTVRPLDDYLPECGGGRILLKIDTEGSEYPVLMGARRLLHDRRPLVIFESWVSSNRRGVYGLLQLEDYDIVRLPWQPDARFAALDLPAFLQSDHSNFIAVPRRS